MDRESYQGDAYGGGRENRPGEGAVSFFFFFFTRVSIVRRHTQTLASHTYLGILVPFWFGPGVTLDGRALEESSPSGFIFSGWVVVHPCSFRRTGRPGLLFSFIA